jgi:hypothetical protein
VVVGRASAFSFFLIFCLKKSSGGGRSFFRGFVGVFAGGSAKRGVFGMVICGSSLVGKCINVVVR